MAPQKQGGDRIRERMFINLLALFVKLQPDHESKSGGTLQRMFYFVFLLLISLSLGTVLVKEHESHGFRVILLF